MTKRKKSWLTVTDQFCGAGGSSLGAVAAGAELHLALNHWRLAIETHNSNFPDALHDCTDISQSDPRRYPSTDVLITSPECTNHSMARGKAYRPPDLFGNKPDPAEERSRATMWDVPRFAERHGYEIVIVENVVDVRKWVTWEAWLHAMRLLGYDHQVVYFNSMFAHMDPAQVTTPHDFAPQSRDRLYVVFWREGNPAPDLDIRPLAWCGTCAENVAAVQSWKSERRRWGRYGVRNQYVYRCPVCAGVVTPWHFGAANAIDWSLTVERIGDRARPLKEKTLQRIQAGIDRFWKTGAVVDLAYTQDNGGRAYSLAGPLPTQTTRQTQALALAQTTMRDTNRGRYPVAGIDAPLSTQTTSIQTALLNLPFVAEFRGNLDARRIDEALGTITAGGTHAGLIYPPFLLSYYGSGNTAPVTGPMPTIPTIDRHALVEPGPAPHIDECGFRMLQPHELQRGMAFPDGYVVLGNKRDQVRQLGNAVTPPVMKLLLQRSLATLA